MKTTIEIPGTTLRRAKIIATSRGISLKQFLTEALEDKLKVVAAVSEPAWLKLAGAFGKTAFDRAETRIQKRIDAEFESFILDTNAVSAFVEGDPFVREKIAAGPGPYLPVIVIGEYWFGLLTARDRERRLAWLKELTRHWTVLEVSVDPSAAYAEVRQTLKERATPIPSNDVWIAALARQHNLSILSADPHFDCVPGVRRISW